MLFIATCIDKPDGLANRMQNRTAHLAYLAKLGEKALSSVGAYQLEGLGAQLMARVEGDHFTIQGIPLLPLLEFLRGQGVVAP